MSDSYLVSWRLNELLEAGKKAKAFAASSEPEGAELMSSSESFSPTTYGSAEEIERPFEEVSPTETESPESAMETDVPIDEVEDDVEEKGNRPELSDQELQLLVEDSDIYKKKIQEAHDAAYQDGLAEGAEKGKEEWTESLQLLKQFLEELKQANEDKAQFFDPLKKLSLHIAKHLVRGELSLSGLAIERLVHESLSMVEKSSQEMIIVYLSSEDKKRYQEFAALDDQLDLREDPGLSSGSVRLSFEDSAIEDLIEHRLSSISKLILDQSDGWKSKDDEMDPLRKDVAGKVNEEIIEGELLSKRQSDHDDSDRVGGPSFDAEEALQIEDEQSSKDFAAADARTVTLEDENLASESD